MPPLSLFVLSLFLGLGAEVECDYSGHHNHNIVGSDVTSEAQNRKDGDNHQGNNGLDLYQGRKVFQDFHMYCLLNLLVYDIVPDLRSGD